VPYVLQIFAALLETSPGEPLPAQFKALIKPLTASTAWETRGNVPGLARLLAAIIPRATKELEAEKQLEPILGIFQRLLGSKKTEQNAFDVLEAVCSSFEA
jgi:exportin-2 (importin alpha re-exporter)